MKIRTLIGAGALLTVFSTGWAARPAPGLLVAAPASSRVIELNLKVDNPAFLDQPYIEVSVANDGYRKKVVAVPDGEGRSSLLVPYGPAQLVLCGMVRCEGAFDKDLVCGPAVVPDEIAVDKIHTLTYSTERACANRVTSSLPANAGFSTARVPAR